MISNNKRNFFLIYPNFSRHIGIWNLCCCFGDLPLEQVRFAATDTYSYVFSPAALDFVGFDEEQRQDL